MEEDSCRVWKMYFSFDFFLRIDRLSFQYLNSESFFWLGTNPPPYGLTAPRQEVKLLTVPLLSSLIPFSTVHLISVITLRLTLRTTSGLRRQFTLDTYCIYTTSWQLHVNWHFSSMSHTLNEVWLSTSFTNYYSAHVQHTTKRCVLPGNIWTNRGINSWQI